MIQMPMKYLKPILVFILVLFCSFLFTTGTSYADSVPSQESRARFNISDLNLSKGTKYVLRIYNSTDDCTIRFKSNDSTIVSIKKRKNSNKEITAFGKNVGTTSITATIKKDGNTISILTCNINVTPQPISVKFRKKKVSLKTGSSTVVLPIIKPNTASFGSILFTTSNSQIVSVNAKGKITGISEGSATITVILPDGQTASYNVIVKPADTTMESTTKPSYPVQSTMAPTNSHIH